MIRTLAYAMGVMVALQLPGNATFAADPGADLPNDPVIRAASQMSDQKKGSVLIYNLYSSSAAGGITNTRINITNTNFAASALVHLFFVADTCQVADSYLCLTPNQTASFLAQDVDPGVTGYLLAVAVSSEGLAAAFDWLIGDEFIRLNSGHFANLGAEAVSVSVTPLPSALNDGGSTATLTFDGVSYNRLPRVLAASNIPARADGNNTLLVVNRIGGNYALGASTLGTVFGLLYDDGENVFSFSFAGGCQVRNSISNSFPRTTPRVETVIPAGRSGWMKLWNAGDAAITGAVLNANLNVATSAGAFSGGHNLHALTLTQATSITIPVFPPAC